MSRKHVTVEVDAAEALEMLDRTRSAAEAAETVHKIAAAAVAGRVRTHLLQRSARRSRRSGYYSDAAEAVSYSADAARGRVSIRHPGIYWHRYGGTISAKPGKAMTIPLRDRLRGVWPSELDPDRKDLFVWRRKGNPGKAFLARREGAALRILYLLLKSVSKSEDPSVLPTDQDMSTAVNRALSEMIRQAIARQSTPKRPPAP